MDVEHFWTTGNEDKNTASNSEKIVAQTTDMK
jgi:hypothetical protein